MKRGIWRKLVSTVLVASMVLASAATSALAAEPDSVQEFRQGTVKMAGQADFNGLGLMMVLKDNGDLWAIGNLSFLGKDAPYDFQSKSENGEFTYYYCTEPKQIMTDISSFELNSGAISIIKKDGSLWTATNDSRQPLLTKKLENVSVAGHNFAVKTDGTLWMWGDDYMGQLGIGKEPPNPDADNMLDGYFAKDPIKIMNNVKNACTSSSHSVALKEDGSVWCWGNSLYGRVGTGEFPDLGSESENETVMYIGEGPFYERTPIKVMDNAIDIAIGEECTLAIKSDNSLWIWGRLPYNYNQCEPSPIKVMDDVKSAVCAVGGIIVLKQDGTMWAIGNDSDGHLGDGGQVSDPTSPHKCLLYDIKDVFFNYRTGFAVKNDGSLWGFGDSAYYFQDRSQNTVVEIPFFETSDFGKTPVQITGSKSIPSPSAESTPEISSATATPTASKVLVNGKEISFDAYEINGNNYFKLRDIANVVSGTGKQFEVTWDGTKNAINLLSNKAYTAVGGELAKGNGSQKPAALNTSKVYLDGQEVSLTAYTINGNNYFKLRDLGQTFNFGVGWDGAANTVTIDTSTSYTAE